LLWGEQATLKTVSEKAGNKPEGHDPRERDSKHLIKGEAATVLDE